MDGGDSEQEGLPSNADRHGIPLPQGYRQGIITAITVFLGFSLAFFRYWGFEADGDWNIQSIAVACVFVVAVALQIIVLFRSLRIEDDNVDEYRKTVRWFITSAVVLFVALLLAVIIYADTPVHK